MNIEEILKEKSATELAIGYRRYEAVRRLQPWKFEILHKMNVEGKARYDDLVDTLAGSNDWPDFINKTRHL